MKDRFVIVNKIITDELLQATEINREYFEGDDVGEVDVYMSWYNKNNNISMFIKKGREVVGYITFMPISKTCFNKFKKGEIKDYHITGKDVRQFVEGKNYGLIVGVAIKKEYKETDAFLNLAVSFYKRLKQMHKKGIEFVSIITDCITEDGENLAKSLNFKFVNDSHGGKVYEGNIT